MINEQEILKGVKSDYCLKIDFDKGSERPERVFNTAARLLEAFRVMDGYLVNMVGIDIEPVLLLEDVEVGSLKIWLRNVISNIDDEAIKELDVKKAVGSFLVKAKYLLIKKLSDRPKDMPLQIDDVKDINYEIVEAAKETGIDKMPYYQELPAHNLLKGIKGVTDATAEMSENDSVSIITDSGTAMFNTDIKLTNEAVSDIATKDSIESTIVMILKIKRPDYIGTASWEFKHETKTINAKISDNDWLKEFHERRVIIGPGDALKASVKTTVKYGHDAEVVTTTYEVLKVINVVQTYNNANQTRFE